MQKQIQVIVVLLQNKSIVSATQVTHALRHEFFKWGDGGEKTSAAQIRPSAELLKLCIPNANPWLWEYIP